MRTSPSSHSEPDSVSKPPGTVLPTSSWWAVMWMAPMSRPSANSGRMNDMSLRCLPVRYESLQATTSPGPSPSRPTSSSTTRTASVTGPQWIGFVMLAAGMAQASSGGPCTVVQKSSMSRITSEKAFVRSFVAMCSFT